MSTEAQRETCIGPMLHVVLVIFGDICLSFVPTIKEYLGSSAQLYVCIYHYRTSYLMVTLNKIGASYVSPTFYAE